MITLWIKFVLSYLKYYYKSWPNIGGLEGKYKPSSALNKKVLLWHGDITRLEIDAIVSSASTGQLHNIMPPTGSVRGALHKAAGPMLDRECQSLLRCHSGTAVVTCGYNLPAKCEFIRSFECPDCIHIFIELSIHIQKHTPHYSENLAAFVLFWAYAVVTHIYSGQLAHTKCFCPDGAHYTV